MTTARDIVTAALRKINIAGAGYDLTSEEANDTFDALNDMLASWSTNGALIYTETKETFSLTGALTYTIGSGADFDTVVPKRITSAFVTYADQDCPVQLIDNQEFSSIADKDLSGVPRLLYFDADYPTANIYLWPINYTGTTLTMFSQKPLTQFTSLNSSFAMPPEYKRALIHNLAVEIAPEYEREANMTVKRIAKQSLDMVKKQNRKNDKFVVKCDSFIPRGVYDIYSGDYR